MKTSGKRLREKLNKVQDWARSVCNRYPLKLIWTHFCAKVEGHIRYYGVSFNTKAIRMFLNKTARILFKQLNRRSQRKSFTWEQFKRFMGLYPPPKVKIHHALF